jgi:hypothetical protein
LNLVRKCRDDLEANKSKALLAPKRYLYMEVDSMDQQKASLPRFARPSSDVDDAALVQMHVTAARVPTVGVFEYVYTRNFAHDGNCNVTCIHR